MSILNKPENPSAFPYGNPAAGGDPGMTLRDWFAGQALIGLATTNHGNDWGTSGVRHGTICAEKAYAIADAMLKERKNG